MGGRFVFSRGTYLKIINICIYIIYMYIYIYNVYIFQLPNIQEATNHRLGRHWSRHCNDIGHVLPEGDRPRDGTPLGKQSTFQNNASDSIRVNHWRGGPMPPSATLKMSISHSASPKSMENGICQTGTPHQ